MKKMNKRAGVRIWLMLPTAALILSCVLPLSAWAASYGGRPEKGKEAGTWGRKQIEIRSGPVAREENYIPEEHYTDESGNEYELQSWTMVRVPVDKQEKNVREQVVYRDVERKEEIPGEYRIQATNERTGQKEENTYPILSLTEVGGRWSEDFSFSLTFHSYDSEYYVLGDQTIPFNEETPQLSGHENQLLVMIGVDPESYRITDIRWDGEPYEDETGVLCRNAIASGLRYVRDYQAVYGGTITFPETEEMVCQAIYVSVSPGWQEARDVIVEPKLKAFIDAENQEEGKVRTLVRRGVVVTISLILVLFLIIIPWFLWRKGREKRNGGAEIRIRKKGREISGVSGGYDTGISHPIQ